MSSKKMIDSIFRKHGTSQPGISGSSFTKDLVEKPCFKVGWNNYFAFWKDYCKKWTEKKSTFDTTLLYEYNTEESSLRFTLVFEFVNRQKILGELEIETILSIIKDSIFKTLQLFDEEAIVCVSTSAGPKFFILDYNFPTIRVDKEVFNRTILPDFIDRLRSKEIKRKLHEFIGDWVNVIQEMTNFSPVFGCKASKDNPPFKFEGVWSTDDGFAGKDIREYFSVSKHALLNSHCPEEIRHINVEDINYMAVIYSSRFSPTVTLPKEEETKSHFSMFSEISSSAEQDMINHLMPLVNKSRFENPMYRWQIARCCYNIFGRERAGLEFWNSYTQKYSKENEELWSQDFPNNTGINDYLSIRTVGYFARLDSPDGYQVWHSSWMTDAIKESLKKIETSVAEVMYRLLWLDFVTVGKCDWYYFVPGGTKLVRSISNVEFKRRFNELSSFYAKFIVDPGLITSQLEAKDSNDAMKIISEIIKKLGTYGYQTAIEKHCFIKFYRERIEQFFDTNPDLIAWGNIVSEVHGNNIYARDGKMEDFLTRGSDIFYVPEEYSWDHTLVKEVLYWFKTTFVDDALVDCFIKIACSFLYGRNKEKTIYAFCGPLGDNSKSMIDKLFKGVFSIHAIDFPVYVLTDSKQSSGGPTPELAQAQSARYASIAEPDGKIPFQGSLIKRYSGGDTFFARACNQDGRSIEPMFKMVLSCNAVPPIDGADEAVERRLVIIPFESKYCDDAPKDVDEQFRIRRFPKDPMFENKIKIYRRPMLWIIMNYFERYMKEGITKPDVVKRWAEKYWEENDPYKMFVGENIIKTGEAGDKITVTNMYKIFKIWYNTYCKSKRSDVPDISLMQRHLTALLGEPDRRIWSGIRIQGGNNEGDGKKKYKID
jgi:hypothetical protein